jgi:hypothetical protein
MDCLEELNAAFGTWLKSDTPQAKWLAGMTKTFRRRELLCFVFGGTLRDLALGREPRDLDLVADEMMWPEIKKLMEPWVERTNRFGGLKLQVPKVGEVDIWPVSSTYGFSSGEVGIKSPLRMPMTVNFNIEAAILECTEVAGGRLGAENRFFDGLKSRTIDFIIPPVIPDPLLTAARAGVMAEKLDFTLSPRLADWCQGVAEKNGWEAIGATGAHHYREKTAADIVSALQRQISRPLPEIPRLDGKIAAPYVAGGVESKIR